jgi:hypothetical protein
VEEEAEKVNDKSARQASRNQNFYSVDGRKWMERERERRGGKQVQRLFDDLDEVTESISQA